MKQQEHSFRPLCFIAVSIIWTRICLGVVLVGMVVVTCVEKSNSFIREWDLVCMKQMQNKETPLEISAKDLP